MSERRAADGGASSPGSGAHPDGRPPSLDLTELLAHVSREALQAEGLEELLRRIVDFLVERLPVTIASIILLDEEESFFVDEVWAGEIDLVVPTGTSWPVTVGVAGRCARSGRPQLIPDVNADPDYVPGNLSVRSEYLVPIRHRARMHGVLNLESTRTDVFTPGACRVFDAIADQVAGAIHLARVVRELEEANRRQEQANRELEAATARAEEANRAKSMFLANMSHELRTPLNAILGFAQLLARRPGLGETDRQHLRRILDSGEHLLGLINDVLSLSRIESGRLVLDLGPFDATALVRGLIEMVRPSADAKGLELDLELGPGWPSMVIGDQGRLRQILINLLGNAIKFTDRGLVVLVAAWHRGRGRFTVRDSGVGIGEDEHRLLFEAFSQTESGRRSKEGSGLGLAVSRQLARALGGDITVDSRPGRGSAFTLEIDLPPGGASEAASLPPAQRVIALAPGQRVPRILVVDDVEDNRALLAGLLTGVGFEVLEAASGEQGIELWRAREPDLVWMDKRMPGVSGLEATAEIRRHESRLGRPRTPIVAVSASALEHERSDILAAGCDDFVPKPFREATIFAKLAEHLGVRYLHDAGPEGEAGSRPSTVTVEALRRLPDAWLAELGRALALGELGQASDLARQLGGEDAALGAAIRGLIDAFELDELETRISAALAGREESGRPAPE